MILMIHGAWHGAWCWNHTQFQLALLKRPSIAVDFANHGLSAEFPTAQRTRPFVPEAMATEQSAGRAIGLEEASRILADQIRVVSIATSGRVTLVAHSLGGVLTNSAAETVAEHVAGIIYVCAITPVNGGSASDYRTAPENEGSRTSLLQTGNPGEIGAARIDAGDDARLKDIKEVFFQDIDDKLARAAAHFMTPDVPIGLLRDPVLTSERFGKIPRAYIVCTHDNALREAAQRRCIGDMDCAYPDRPTDISVLHSSHSPFFSCPRELAWLIDMHSRKFAE